MQWLLNPEIYKGLTGPLTEMEVDNLVGPDWLAANPPTPPSLNDLRDILHRKNMEEYANKVRPAEGSSKSSDTLLTSVDTHMAGIDDKDKSPEKIPLPSYPTIMEVSEEFSILDIDYRVRRSEYDHYHKLFYEVYTWIYSTVDPDILIDLNFRSTKLDSITLRGCIHFLKIRLAPHNL
ncbi:hypothetical protein ACMFMG_001095 [Clarireedia jacksonii]